MSDIIGFKNGNAIDARFQAVDERFSSVNKDIGKLEKRIDDIESQQSNHHDGISKHDWAIDGLTKALEKVSASIEEFSEIKHQIKGGIKLWKWFLAPIGGVSGLVYMASKSGVSNDITDLDIAALNNGVRRNSRKALQTRWNCFCCTLEEPWKDNKRKVSCIPAGTYKVVKHNSKKYQDVWRLENVPNRDGILIHAGNTTDDIEGCILVGKSFGKLMDKSAVLDSRAALSELRMAIKGDFYLRIVDRVNKEEK